MPESLQANVLLELVLANEKRTRRLRRRALAVAAGVLLVAGVGGGLGLDHWRRPADLPVTVINHVEDELPHLHEDRNVPPEALAALLAPFSAEVVQPLSHVNYAGRCAIRRHAGVHLVLPGNQGPVTVLMMPGEPVERSTRFQSGRFDGLILPTAFGSMAVIGERGEALNDIAVRVSQAIRWPNPS